MGEDDIKGRLAEFVASLGVSRRRFELECGLSNGFLNNTNGNLSAKKLAAISGRHPELDTEWLLTGVGAMRRKAAPSPSRRTVELEAENARLRELVAQQAVAIEALRQAVAALAGKGAGGGEL